MQAAFFLASFRFADLLTPLLLRYLALHLRIAFLREAAVFSLFVSTDSVGVVTGGPLGPEGVPPPPPVTGGTVCGASTVKVSLAELVPTVALTT